MEVDTDGNGTIDFFEFLAMMKKKSCEKDDFEVKEWTTNIICVYLQDLKDAFRMFDTNNDGFIDLVELRKVKLISRGSPLVTSAIQHMSSFLTCVL